MCLQHQINSKPGVIKFNLATITQDKTKHNILPPNVIDQSNDNLKTHKIGKYHLLPQLSKRGLAKRCSSSLREVAQNCKNQKHDSTI